MKPHSKALLPLLLTTLAATALLLTGCGAPTTRGIVGSTPLQLDPEDWNGHWRSDDGSYTIRVADAENGILEVVQVGESEKALHVSVNHLYLREENHAILFNLNDDESGSASYIFGRMVRKNDAAVLWTARTESMERLIARQMITGVVKVQDKTREVTITGGYENLARQLATEEGWLMLELGDPITLLREHKGL